MDKTFKFDIKDMNTHFEIDFKGDMTTNDAYVFTDNAIKLSEQKNVFKYLIDAKQATLGGTKQGMEVFVNFDMDLIMPKHPYRLAILMDPDNMTNQFFINLLKNNNYDARLFTDENEAKEWLLED